MVFVLNVNSKDSTSFMSFLNPEINTKGLILWDNNFSFETSNELLTPVLNQRTFLVNRNNKIVVIGNPLLNPRVLKQYKKFINKYSKFRN